MSNMNSLQQLFLQRRRRAFGSTVAIVGVALGLLLTAFAGPATAGVYGRVSHIDGELMLRGADEDDWSYAGLNTTLQEGDGLWTDADSLAEVELGYGMFVRVGYGTELYLDEMPREAELRLVTGSLYLSRPRGDGSLRVTTPTAAVRVRKSSLVRVDVAEDGSTRIGAVHGSAELATSSSRTAEVETGWRVFVYRNEGPSGWEQLRRGDDDEFDRFNKDRDEYLEEVELPEDVDPDIVGVYDLPRHGRWISIESASYWRPTISHWNPYRHGRWGWLHTGGWSWCDDYPFGYTTGHYGRWRWMPQYGWVWKPGYAWGPGWVSWWTSGDCVGWAPLDPWDRPARVSIGLSFPIGDHGFLSIGACSYAPRHGFHSGYVRAQPFTSTTINIINRNDIRIVDNSITHNEFTYVDHSFGHNVHHNLGGLFRPRVQVRGPERDDHGHRAADVVKHLDDPRERAKHWSWRSRDVDPDALQRLRDARPERIREAVGGPDRGRDGAVGAPDRLPNMAGRDPSAWTQRPDWDEQVKGGGEQSRDRWSSRESRQGDEGRPSEAAPQAPDRRPTSWLNRGDTPRTPFGLERNRDGGAPAAGEGKPAQPPSQPLERRPTTWLNRGETSRTPPEIERSKSSPTPESARPTWLNREPSGDERRPQFPFGASGRPSAPEARPSVRPAEPEKPAATDRTPSERPTSPWVRSAPSTERYSRPPTSSSFARPEPKPEAEPSRPEPRIWNRSSEERTTPSPTARPSVVRPAVPDREPSRPSFFSGRTERSEPERSIWTRPSPSPEQRTVTAPAPTHKAPEGASSASRFSIFSRRESSGSTATEPSRSSARSEHGDSGHGRSSSSRGSSSSAKSSDDRPQESGQGSGSGRSSSWRGGGSRR